MYSNDGIRQAFIIFKKDKMEPPKYFWSFPNYGDLANKRRMEIPELGNTNDFYLSHRRNTLAAKRFLKKTTRPVMSVSSIPIKTQLMVRRLKN
jgi:hypothetical protein